MSNLVDYIPILQHVPSPIRARGRKLHRDLVETYGGLINDIDIKMRRGEDVPECLAKTMLQVREAEKLDDLDIAMIASAFMIGGVETVGQLTRAPSAHSGELADRRYCRLLPSCSGFLPLYQLTQRSREGPRKNLTEL